jgi:hypothetical protein
MIKVPPVPPWVQVVRCNQRADCLTGLRYRTTTHTEGKLLRLESYSGRRKVVEANL